MAREPHEDESDISVNFLLVRPHVSLRVARTFHAFLHLEPLDLEIVAGGIDRRHSVRILDLTMHRRPEHEFGRALREHQPDVIGFTGYSNQAPNVMKLAALAKAWRPACTTLAGGIHATIAPEYFAGFAALDLVVRGEGATAMRDLVPQLEQGLPAPDDPRFLDPRALHFAAKAALPPPALPDYAQVPPPRRDLVDRASYYCIWTGHEGERMEALFPRTATMRTSVGCPFRCSFCVVHYLANGRYVPREPEDVVDEIAAIPEDHIYFVDDEMFIQARRTEAIARLLIERGIRKRYISWARSDTICRSPGQFQLWKQAGLDVLYVGLESLEEKNLANYNKGFKPDVNIRAVQILRELGIHLHAALMVNPDFTAEDFLKVRKSIDFLVPAEVTFTVFSPPPGTELWKKSRDSFVCRDPHGFYDCMHTLLPTRLPLNQFYRYFSLLYLFAFQKNPWRMRHVKAPLRDVARLFVSGAICGHQLRRIYRDYERKHW